MGNTGRGGFKKSMDKNRILDQSGAKDKSGIQKVNNSSVSKGVE